MAQYISKDALVAELERRIRNYWSDTENAMGIYPYALEEVIKYVNTLEVKEVDLEKEPASEDSEGTAKILKEKEAMWMQDPSTGEFIPVSYPADAPLGQDMKGNLIYPDDLICSHD